MTTTERPNALYRGVKGSGAGSRATIVCALQHDGVTSVPLETERVSWTARAATILREIGREGEDSASARGNSLPYASLRAAIASVVPEAVMLERDLGAPWSETPRPFLDVAATDGLAARLGRALTLWVALALRPWAEKVGASEDLTDALHGLAGDAFTIARREGSLADVLSSGAGFQEVRDAIVQRLAQALEGRELFAGLGPAWRIVRGRSNSNEVEFMTWPSQHDEALYSMVATLTVETVPFLTQPIVTVCASRRRWLGELPSGRPLAGQRAVTVTLMGREGPKVALEVSAPVRAQAVQEPVAPEFLGQLLRLGGDLAAPLADLVGQGAGGSAFVGIAYSPKLGGRHPIGAGVSTRDQTDLFEAVQDAADEIGFVPLAFEETPSLKRAPKRSSELHKALEVEALLSEVAIAIGRNDIEDDASIEAAWSSLGLGEDGPAIGAAAAAKAREKLAEVRSANVERVARVFGDRIPSVVVIARTDGERQLLQSVLVSLFGKSIGISPRPLPQDVHGPRATLPEPKGKSVQRFEARVKAWRPLAEVLRKMEDGCHALVQASYWYDGRPDDPVNKPAGRYALASEASANVQYLRPREAGQRGFANYLHRVQAAIYDLVFGHSGLVSEVSEIVAETFADAEHRPTSIIGISVLAQARTRTSGKSGKLCIATRIDCATGRTTARVGWHDVEMRWSAAWEPLFEALKRIASPSIKASLGSGIAIERASFQSFVREVLDDCAEVGDRPLVMIDSTSAASLWPWLTDGQLGGDITLGSERLDVSRRWPGIRLVRVRLGHAARIAESKTAEYRGVDMTTGADNDDVLERYCPTIVARTVRLSANGATAGHYWSTAGYFQMSLPRGLSVYRTLISLVPVAKAFRDVPLQPTNTRLFVPVGISIFDVSYRLPNPLEITVAAIREGDEPDRIAHLVASLRYGYGHTAASTSLPAPLSFESKARDYMTRFALDVTEEKDDEAAEIGLVVDGSEDRGDVVDGSEDLGPVAQLGYDLAWRELVDQRDVSVADGAALAEAQLAMTGEFPDPGVGRESAVEDVDGLAADAGEGEVSRKASASGWSELAPVIRLPDFVTLDWLAEYVHVPNAQLRAMHQARNEICSLSGYRAWPELKPDRCGFLAILQDGLRYPRFAAAITQAARRSLAPAKAQHWSPMKPLWHLAYSRSQTFLQSRGMSTSALNSTRGVAETLADAGEVELAMGHVFRRAYMERLRPDMVALIETDARFEPLRSFVSDAALHLFRDDYEWSGDLRRFPTRPAEAAAPDPVAHAPSDTGPAPEVTHDPLPGTLRSIVAEPPVLAADGGAGADPEPSGMQTSEAGGDTSRQEKPEEFPIEFASPDRGSDEDAPGRVPDWSTAMAAIVAVANDATDPAQGALDRMSAHFEEAVRALAAWHASRPKGVDATPFVDRALRTFALALSVLIDAEEPQAGLPATPAGPFVTVIELELASSLEDDLGNASIMADAARATIGEVQRVFREMQLARLQEALSLKAEAVASGRDAASLAVEILGRLKAPDTTAEVEAGSRAEAASETKAEVAVLTPRDPDEIDTPVDPVDLDWDSSSEADADDGALPQEADGLAGWQTVEPVDEPSADSVAPEADPMRPQLLLRFGELVEGRHYGLAYHLQSASAAARLCYDFPITPAELRLAAIAGHVNHSSTQGGDLVHGLLSDAYATFESMEDEAPGAVSRRISVLPH